MDDDHDLVLFMFLNSLVLKDLLTSKFMTIPDQQSSASKVME